MYFSCQQCCVLRDDSLLLGVEVDEDRLLGVGPHLHQVLAQVNIDLPLIDDLPQRVRVLLDPEEHGEGGAVVDVGRDAAAAPRLLRQVHDLLRGACTSASNEGYPKVRNHGEGPY